MDRKLQQIRNFDQETWLMNQLETHSRAIGLDFKKNVFKADGVAPNMDGLESLVAGSQLLTYTDGVNGDHITDAQVLVEEINRGIDACIDVPAVIGMNRSLMGTINALALATAANNALAGIFRYSTIEINGRRKRVGMWNDIPVVPVDNDSDGSAVLAFDETVGTSTDCSSIYFISSGSGRHYLLQDKPIEVVSFEEKGGTQYVLDWGVNQVVLHPDAVIRMQGVRDPATAP